MEAPLRNVDCVPHLFREQAALVGKLLHRSQQLLGGFRASSRQLVVASFPGEQRPKPTSPGSIKRRAVLVFPVTVAVVSVPARTIRCFDSEQRIDDRDRVLDTWIVGCAQTESHQGESIRTDEVGCGCCALLRGAVLDRNETLERRCSTSLIHRADPYVVAIHADLPSP